MCYKLSAMTLQMQPALLAVAATLFTQVRNQPAEATMKIAILTTNQAEDDNRLVAAARAKGHQANLLDLRQISIALRPSMPDIYYQNELITGAVVGKCCLYLMSEAN